MSYLDDYIARINDIGATSSDYYKNMQQDIVNNGFEDSPTLVDGKLNGFNLRFRVSAFFNRKTLTMNPDSYQKVIFKDIQQVIKIGDILEFNNLIWICTETTTSTVACSCLVTRSNNTLKFYSNSVLSTIPCFVGKGNISLSIDKFISLASDEYIISCPNTVDSLKIVVGTRFILNGGAYKVEGTDTISVNGLIDIRVKEDLIDSVDDNILLNIANYYSHQPVQELYILNGTSATLLYSNTTLQLSIHCKENNAIVDNSRVTYTSDHLNVATVSTTGLITAIGTGDSIIVATFGTVSASIAIHGDMTVIDNYSISITPSDTTLKISRSLITTSHFWNNGVEVFNQNCIWGLTNSDGTSNVYATLVTNGFDCTVTASSNSSYVGKYIKLRSTLVSDNTKYTEKEIKIVGLF